jgi:hypothetical protein
MTRGNALSPRRRRARTTLLGAVVVLIVAQGMLAMAVERWLPVLADSKYSFRYERLQRRLEPLAERPLTVVMLGSSRTLYGFDAQGVQARLAAQLPAMPLVHNFGVPGAGPINHRLHLERLLADGIHLDLVLVEIAPPLMFSGTGIAPEQELISPTRLRRHELAVLDQYQFSTQAARAEWWQRWVIPCYYYRFGLISALSPSLLPSAATRDYWRSLDEACWLPLPPSGAADAPEARQREADELLRVNRAVFHVPMCAASCRALRDTVELCRRENIRVALVWMPEAACFRDLYPPEAKNAIRHLLQQMEETQGVPLIDASAWITDDQFSNPHYLLTTGAATLAERLSRAVLPLLPPHNDSRAGK